MEGDWVGDFNNKRDRERFVESLKSKSLGDGKLVEVAITTHPGMKIGVFQGRPFMSDAVNAICPVKPIDSGNN